tara:strand:- start:14066 stop:16987 length:2922 start_codon:yes stop_codon:yes gene_type:complete
MKFSLRFFLVFSLFHFFYISINNAFSQKTELWGMTTSGSGLDLGVVFKTDSFANSASIVDSFKIQNNGWSSWSSLVEIGTDTFYGATLRGGAFDKGVLYRYVISEDTIQNLIDFDGQNTGSFPSSKLIVASNGKLFGIARNGGLNNRGVLYEYDPISNAISIKVNFDGLQRGETPESISIATNGKIYGTTYLGGINNGGVIFEYDPQTGVFDKKHDFESQTSGLRPAGNILISNGFLYGTSLLGGANSDGVLYEYDLSNFSFKNLISFNASVTGASPNATLIRASNGNLYGLTEAGGINNDGVLYEFNPNSGLLIKRIDFEANITGSSPQSGLVEANNGKLYGTCMRGALSDDGSLFEYDITTNQLVKKVDLGAAFQFIIRFKYIPELIQAKNGKLYGTTDRAGLRNLGTIFSYDINNEKIDVEVDFSTAPNGGTPNGSLVQASSGMLYGLTSIGGINNDGVIFEINPVTHSFQKKYDFIDSINGRAPQGDLIQASDGNLYGLTLLGGANNLGTLFEYNLSNDTLINHFDFNGSMGSLPNGALVESHNGILYGLTSSGGNNGTGTLFRFDLKTKNLTKVLDFETSIGTNPRGSLTKASNNKLYGLTVGGGVNNSGVLFEFDVQNEVLLKKVDFNNSLNGSQPRGKLVQVGSELLYGMTLLGGANQGGVIFEYNFIEDKITKKADFNQFINGNLPNGSLLNAKNGKLFGMTTNGGLSNNGILFEFDTSTNSIIKKLDFASINARSPWGSLIEVEPCVFTQSVINELACSRYILPSKKDTILNPGNHIIIDTLTNFCGKDSIITINLSITEIDTSVTTTLDSLIANQRGAQYQWLRCEDNFTTINGATMSAFSPSDERTYACEITLNNCIDTTACYRLLIDETCNIDFPNVFTPNGDQVNDLFLPTYQCNFQSFQLKVFNRWGHLVFSAESPELTWDGRVDGLKAESGTYFYLLNYKAEGNSHNRIKKGSFTLLY